MRVHPRRIQQKTPPDFAPAGSRVCGCLSLYGAAVVDSQFGYEANGTAQVVEL